MSKKSPTGKFDDLTKYYAKLAAQSKACGTPIITGQQKPPDDAFIEEPTLIRPGKVEVFSGPESFEHQVKITFTKEHPDHPAISQFTVPGLNGERHIFVRVPPWSSAVESVFGKQGGVSALWKDLRPILESYYENLIKYGGHQKLMEATQHKYKLAQLAHLKPIELFYEKLGVDFAKSPDSSKMIVIDSFASIVEETIKDAVSSGKFVGSVHDSHLFEASADPAAPNLKPVAAKFLESYKDGTYFVAGKAKGKTNFDTFILGDFHAGDYEQEHKLPPEQMQNPCKELQPDTEMSAGMWLQYDFPESKEKSKLPVPPPLGLSLQLQKQFAVEMRQHLRAVWGKGNGSPLDWPGTSPFDGTPWYVYVNAADMGFQGHYFNQLVAKLKTWLLPSENAEAQLRQVMKEKTDHFFKSIGAVPKQQMKPSGQSVASALATAIAHAKEKNLPVNTTLLEEHEKNKHMFPSPPPKPPPQTSLEKHLASAQQPHWQPPMQNIPPTSPHNQGKAAGIMSKLGQTTLPELPPTQKLMMVLSGAQRAVLGCDEVSQQQMVLIYDTLYGIDPGLFCKFTFDQVAAAFAVAAKRPVIHDARNVTYLPDGTTKPISVVLPVSEEGGKMLKKLQQEPDPDKQAVILNEDMISGEYVELTISGLSPEEAEDVIKNMKKNGTLPTVGKKTMKEVGNTTPRIFTWEFKSQSMTAGGKPISYETILHENGDLSCNCMGWCVGSAKSPEGRHCKHTEAVKVEAKQIHSVWKKTGSVAQFAEAPEQHEEQTMHVGAKIAKIKSTSNTKRVIEL